MYTLQKFIACLTLAEAKPVRKYFSVTAPQGRELANNFDQVVRNAAGIGRECSALIGDVSAIDNIKAAAERLADIENAAGFDWAVADCDWQTTCARIAQFIADNGEAPSIENIRANLFANVR